MKKFEDLYNEISVNNELKESWEQAKEEERKVKTVTIPVYIIITIILLIVIKKFIGFNIMAIPFAGFIIIFVNLMVFMISQLFRKQTRRYNNVFKKVVIEKLIENFYDNIEYFPNKEMPERIYEEAEYNEDYDEYYSDDYIEAKINNEYDIEMAEVITQHVETRTDSDGNTHTTTTTKFHGLFEKVTIDKSIKSELKIECNGSYHFSKNRLEMDSR